MTHRDFVRQLDHRTLKLPSKTSSIFKLSIDGYLLILLLLISILGLFILYSASGQNIEIIWKQTQYLSFSFLVMIILAQIDSRVWSLFSKWLYLVGLIILIVIPCTGIYSKGAQRWIEIFHFRFQPSEFMKLIIPITVASFIANRSIPPSLKDILYSFIIIGIPVGLIVIQPDLGTALLVCVSGLFIIFLAGIKKRIIFFFIMPLIPSTYVFWKYSMYSYQKRRILTFFNPEQDPLGAGWNIIQSKIAIGSGGIFGKGWLKGTQSHLDFLPESHTDFILAVLAEEFGLLGCLCLLLLYSLILIRSLYIALHADTLFGKLLSGSITLTFFVYVFVNIGMVSGILPVVGVPLPLVSRGGSSLLTLLSGFGLLMSIHNHKNASIYS